MAVLSKISAPSDLTCYDLCHPWSTNCLYVTGEIGLFSLINGVKVYLSVYLLSSLVQGKLFDPKKWGKLFQDILRSSIFLSANSALFLGSICVVRRILQRFYIPTVSFVPALIASSIAIMIERESRRKLLSVYMVNMMSDMVYRSLLQKGLIQAIPHAEVLLFSFTMSIFMYFYKKRDNSKDLISAVVGFLIGSDEGGSLPKSKPAKLDNFGKQEIPEKSKSQLKQLVGFIKSLPDTLVKSNKFFYQLQIINTILQRGSKHHSCLHNYNCIYYSITGFLRSFFYGYLIQVVLTAISTLKKRPSSLLQQITKPQTFRLGLFMGLFTGSFKMVNCLLRWITNCDSSVHGLIAGFIAGSSMLVYPAPSASSYVFWKLIEFLCVKGVETKNLPKIPFFAEIVYSLATASVFHSAFVEPDIVKPSYLKFMDQSTGQRLAHMNRFGLLDIGIKPGKFFPPRNDPDPRYSSDAFKKFLRTMASA